MSLNNNQAQLPFSFGNHELVMMASSSLYWPAKKTLILADLHLEKGSYFAKRGNPLPLYDSFDTLMRLNNIVDEVKPHTIITLGDSLHDNNAFKRMNPEVIELLHSIINKVARWEWIVGNHDCQFFPIAFSDHVQITTSVMMDNILFHHDFSGSNPLEIVGHYHPEFFFKRIKGKCFLVNKNKLIMPSFGCYTGGLNVETHELIKKENFNHYLIYNNKIWRVK